MDEGTRGSRPRCRKKVCVRAMVSMLGIAIGSVLFAYAAFATAVGPVHDDASIRQVIFVFRHGDRTPTKSYPTDPYRDYEWQGGWGALTKKGMLELYNVGRWIRKEYGRIVGRNYESDRCHVQSSYADRCIMSALALLAAVYPPSADRMFLPGFPWTPVPVHSTPRDLDKMIVVKAPCPRLEQLLREAYANESTRPGTPPAEYYRELSAHTGQNISTITDVEFIYNTLEIEKKHGLELPEWTNRFYNQEMREIAARSLAIFTSNALQQRLRGGPLLKEIMERMTASNRGTDTRRAYFYSAHDITLVNLFRTMGFVDEYFKPELGATLVFQLRAGLNIAEDAEVELIYLNSTTAATAYPMKIPNCGTPCLLGNLINVWKNVVPENWDDECHL